MPEIAAFYRDRGFRPVWVSGSALRPEAGQLLRMLGGRPRRRSSTPRCAAARDGDPHRLTRADLLLSRAYADLCPAPISARPRRNAMRYIDAGLAPARAVGARHARGRGRSARRSPRISGAVERINPVYDGLKRGLAAYRARWSRLPQIQAAARAPGEAALRQPARRQQPAPISRPPTALPSPAAPIRPRSPR